MAMVEVRDHGAVRVLELARPDAGNALSGALVTELTAALETTAEAGLRAVVITGAGRTFCAGADLGELAASVEAPEDEQRADAVRLGACYRALLRSPLLTAAAVSGPAYGGGVGLAAACDLVIAGPRARFQLSELRLGFVPALISVFLPRRVLPARLAELMLDPAPLEGAAAVACGLADATAADPLEEAIARCERMAQRTAPSAVAATKSLLLELTLPELDRSLELAAEANARQRAHPECRRGVAHFLAHRTFPDWSS